MAVFVRSYMQAEAMVTKLRDENNLLLTENARLRRELDEAVRTVKTWHRTALEMRDMSITGKGDIDGHYMNAAMSLPFYGAEGEPAK